MFHKAVHSSAAYVNAIVTLKQIVNFVHSKSLFVFGIDIEDVRFNQLIFIGSFRRFREKMFVIGAAINS